MLSQIGCKSSQWVRQTQSSNHCWQESTAAIPCSCSSSSSSCGCSQPGLMSLIFPRMGSNCLNSSVVKINPAFYSCSFFSIHTFCPVRLSPCCSFELFATRCSNKARIFFFQEERLDNCHGYFYASVHPHLCSWSRCSHCQGICVTLSIISLLILTQKPPPELSGMLFTT